MENGFHGIHNFCLVPSQPARPNVESSLRFEVLESKRASNAVTHHTPDD
jgi:hypothetical protein